MLTTPGHDGALYELTGPELISYPDAVIRLSAAIGKPLKYVDVPEATAREGMLASGVPPALADSMLRYFAGVKAGKISPPTPTVAEVLGRPARTFDQWLNENAAALK